MTITLDICDLTRQLADHRRLRVLHDQLAAAAQADGVLDIAYRIVDTPVGSLLLAATERGLVRVAYTAEDHDAVLQSLADRISPRVLRAPTRLDRAARQIEEYFARRRTTFDLALDGNCRPIFGTRCCTAWPSTCTTGRPSATACWRLRSAVRPRSAPSVPHAPNPLPIVIPCHRVVRADGSIGDYLGGPEAKRTLLAMEAAA